MTEADPVCPAQIDRHLESVLSDTDDAGLPLVHEVVDEPSDRWYGQLVVNAYVSVTDISDPETVLPAAAGIELLRAYVRLRSRLLVKLADNYAYSFTLDPTSALLAGDYLYTAAFSSLGSVPDTPSSDCFQILTSVLETITDAFARTYTPAGSADYDQAVFLDETAGSLGEGAAALGATLAGLDEPNRRHFERLGRRLSTARQIDRILDAPPREALVVLPEFDEAQLQTHAERRREDADQALDALSKTVDVTCLRTVVKTTEPSHDQMSSATNDNASD
jgi:hypothetical protein